MTSEMNRALVALSIVLLTSSAGRGAGTGEPPSGEPPSGEPRSERLHYRWRLEGLSGVISRLLRLLPTTGDAWMELRVEPYGRLEVAFTATSEQAREGDFWKYETLVDLGSWRSVKATETLHFRKKKKNESWNLEELAVIDVLGGLQLLRFSPPAEAERRTIWSDEKLYPVTVSSDGLERRLLGSREVTVRHVAIRGIREPNQRRWKGQADIWLTDDEAAVPLEILYSQSLGRLRMTLVDTPASSP